MQFSEILHRVQPLRDEVDKLAAESEGLREQHKEQLDMIDELEKSIAVYKDEYAVLIRETETIKGALCRAVTTSFGSVCLGALLVALLRTLRFLLQLCRRYSIHSLRRS